MLHRIKKNDTVLIISGKDKGKKGNVVDLDTKKGSVLVKGIGIITKHIKAKKSGQASKVVKEESFIKLCKVMPVCPACKKNCKIQTRQLADGGKVRICNICKEAF